MKFDTIIREFISNKVLTDRTATVLTAAYVSQGVIDVSKYKTLTIYPKYVNGDETSAQIKVTELHTTGGEEHQLGQYTNSSGTHSKELWEYSYTVSQNAIPITINVTGKKLLKIYTKATGGIPTGTMKIDYLKSSAS